MSGFHDSRQKRQQFPHVMLKTPCLSRQGLWVFRAAKEMLVEVAKMLT
jgi:hypothetical protein